MNGKPQTPDLTITQGIPVLTDTSVANDIYNNVDLGDIVRETQFEKVARLLVQIKAI